MVLPVGVDDLPFLWEMLTEAAFPPGTPRPDDPRADDHVTRYLDRWGRVGDIGLVTSEGTTPTGAAWLRLMPPDQPGYGWVDAATPELTVAIAEQWRGQGRGRSLVAGMLDLAEVAGFEQVSLSVADEVNPAALHLYESLGFTPVGRDPGGSLTMVASSKPAAPLPYDPTSTDAVAPSPPVSRRATVADGPALARLRAAMFATMGATPEAGWVSPFLTAWAEEATVGAWKARVVDDPRGRPVASALASESRVPPAPTRPNGRGAHIGSVITEAAWRRRGLARRVVGDLVADLDASGVEATTLTATGEAAQIYLDLGFDPVSGQAMRR